MNYTLDNLPLFFQDWYLDLVCEGDSWKYLEFKENGKIEALMPVFIKKKGPFRYITQPPLSQFHGPLIFHSPGIKNVKRYSREEKIHNFFINEINELNCHWYNQNWAPQSDNWYPFYKAGFSMSVRYTHVITDISDLEKVWDDFDNKLRTDIRKAEKVNENESLVIEESDDGKALYQIQKKTFHRQGKEPPFSESFYIDYVKTLQQKGKGQLWLVRYNDQVVSCAFFGWDSSKIYYLLGGADPEFRNLAPQSLLLWRVIQKYSVKGLAFDFEGSMVPGIEKAFRAYGGEKESYYQVQKNNNPVISVLRNLTNK